MNTMENADKEYKFGLVIMASGLGKRFGGNKLLAKLQGKPLIKWVFDATEEIFDKRIVVTRSSSILKLCKSLNIDCILHEFPGRNDTVRLGLNEISSDIDYCFFMQGDQPLISSISVKKMISEAHENNEIIVRAGFNDSIGAPMGFPRRFFSELLTLPEGKGGNFIAKKNPSCVKTIQVSYEYELWDVDTQQDLERIEAIARLKAKCEG